MKSSRLPYPRKNTPSLPVRGAWVEMVEELRREKIPCVAPRAGSVG